MSERRHRVWIELEQPKDDAEAEQIVTEANRMLGRLRRQGDRAKHFGWDAKRKQFTYGDEMGYENLVDRGQWFSLSHLGRPEEAL
jgi:hypothetical protein